MTKNVDYGDLVNQRVSNCLSLSAEGAGLEPAMPKRASVFEADAIATMRPFPFL